MFPAFIKNNTWYCVAALLAICMINTPFTIYNTLTDNNLSWSGLDIAWEMTLNYARMHNWVWGKDIVFTYGPLGFLSTRIGLGISKWVFVLFDLFIVANFFFVFSDLIKRSGDKFLAVAILAGVTLCVNTNLGTDLSLVILFFTIYWMFKIYYDPRWSYLIILILLALLSFYIKMNTAVVAIIFLFIHLAALRFWNIINFRKLLLTLGLFLTLLILSALLLHVSVINYIQGSLHLLGGYGSIMYLEEDHHSIENHVYILFYSMLLLFLWQIFLLIKEKRYQLIIYSVASIAYIFLLQKQSVLRNDVQHLVEYFSCGTLILLCGIGDRVQINKNYLRGALLIVVCTLVFSSENKPIDLAVCKRFFSCSGYIKGLKGYNTTAYLNQPDYKQTPVRVLNKIGNKTVDIYPCDALYPLENRLSYTPRPIFQAYTAYTEGLENINYNYYLSKAPSFILYDYDGIDGRYPFNDETLINLFIAQNYSVADSFTSNGRWMMLLQKNTRIDTVKLLPKKVERFVLGDEITVGNVSFVKMDISYNLSGKLRAFWNRPPRVKIVLTGTDGSSTTYKTSPELLKAGLFIGKMVTSTKEYATLITNKDLLDPIQKIRVDIDSDSYYFNKEGAIQYFNLPDQDTNFVSLTYKDFILTNPNQFFNGEGKNTIALWSNYGVTSKPISIPVGKYKLTVVASGTPANGVFPHLNVYVNNIKIGNYFTTSTFSGADFFLEQKNDENPTLRIEMDNDELNAEKHEDRNAFIYRVFLNRAK